MERQTILIALEAIKQWRKQIEKEQGLQENPRFDADTKKAMGELRRLLTNS